MSNFLLSENNSFETWNQPVNTNRGFIVKYPGLKRSGLGKKGEHNNFLTTITVVFVLCVCCDAFKITKKDGIKM